MVTGSKHAKFIVITLIILAILVFFSLQIVSSVEYSARETFDIGSISTTGSPDTGWQDCDNIYGGQDEADAFCSCKGYYKAVSCNYMQITQQTGKWKWDVDSSKDNCYTSEFDGRGGIVVIQVKCCMKETEVCDGYDNDCDDLVDNDDEDLQACKPPANVVQALCMSGECSIYQCDFGYIDCDDNYDNGCEVDINTDKSNCGSCGTTCSFWDDCCDGTCTDVKEDETNCGGCDISCATGETCCFGECYDTDTSEKFCGSCSTECSEGKTCCDGVCLDECGEENGEENGDDEGEDIETICDDKKDNDADGAFDCADSDCDGRKCGTKNCPAGSTGSCTKLCFWSQSRSHECEDCSLVNKCKETDCSDTKDNDDDGLIDCSDPDCDSACGTITCEGTAKKCSSLEQETCKSQKECKWWLVCFFGGDCEFSCSGTATPCKDLTKRSSCEIQKDCYVSGAGKPCIDTDGDDYGAEGTDTSNCKYSEEDCDDDNEYINPGVEKEEDCEDGKDNDCNGKIDEDDVNCNCGSGETRKCGPENEEGECQKGDQTCVNKVWGKCINATYPTKETCNTLDDDCDGITDNINGKKSISETQCRCYKDSAPKNETCNAIDDDCNEKIDEDWDKDKDGYVDEDAEECEDVYDKDEYDCDDSESNINPGARERCTGSIDEDCDGDPHNGCDKNESIFDQTIPSPSCGDGICEVTESTATCCTDCGCPLNLKCVGTICRDALVSSAVCGDGVCDALRGETTATCSTDCKGSGGLYAGLVAIIVILSIVAGFLLYRKKQQMELDTLTEEHGVHEPDEAMPQDINTYIKNTLSLGYSPQQIKDALLAKGWDEETANNELAGVHGDISAMGLKIIEKPSTPTIKPTTKKTAPKKKAKKIKSKKAKPKA